MQVAAVDLEASEKTITRLARDVDLRAVTAA
jgi:hypothetical protein